MLSIWSNISYISLNMSWTSMLRWNGNYYEQIIHLISLNLCEKQLWEGPSLKKFTTKINWKKILKHIRNRNLLQQTAKKKERKLFFNGLNPSFVTDNKLFCKMIKPFFSNRGNYGSQIKLEKDEALQDDDLIAKELNKFFKGLFKWRWAAPVRRAGLPRWDLTFLRKLL